MNKRITFLTVLIILCCIVMSNFVVASVGEFLYDGIVTNGESVNIDGSSYELLANSGRTKVKFSSDVKTAFIDVGTCQIVDRIQVCLNSIFEESGMLQISFSVYRKEPEIMFTKMVTPLSTAHDVFLDVELITQNNGSDVAEYVLIYDALPDNAEVEGPVRPCTNTGEAIVWSGTILSGDIILCDYKLNFIEVTEFTSRAKLNYIYEESNVTLYSDTESLNISPLILYDIDVSKQQLPIYNITTFTVNIESDAQETIKPEIIIAIPSAFEVDDTTLSKIKSSTDDTAYYVWNEDLDSGEIFEENIRVKGIELYDGNIYLYGNYTYDNRLYVLDQKTESISVVKSAEDNTTSLGSLDLSLNVSSKTLEAGEMFRVEYLFYNRYMDYDVTNVRAYLSINDEVKSSFTKSLLPALNAMRVKSYGVSNKDTNLTFYTDPAWGTKTNIEVEVLAEFNGTEIKIMNSTNITIKESPQIKVTTEFSSTNVTEGELVQCTVSIANLKKAPINNLSVYEVIPKGVSVLSGTYERVNMYMSPESNITAYSYFFTVPSGYKSEKFQTVAIYEFYGEEEKVETLTNLNVSESKRLNVSQELATNKTWLGEVVPLVYEIVNDGDEEIRDVTIIITPVVGIGYEKYEFFKRRILPKTKISLSNDMHIMKSGKLEIPVVKVEYKIGTTKYTKEIDAITIMVNASTIASPLIVGTLDTTYFTSSGNYTYMMNVENKGKQQTTVTIENNSETIKAFSEGSIKFLKDADIREEAILGYEFVGRMFYTHFSNKKMKTIDYKNNKKQEKASKNNKKSDKNNKDVKDSDLNSDSDATSENSIVKEQTKKSLFSIILIILAGVVCCVLVAGAGVYLFLKKKPPSIANADSYLTESDIKKENNDSETDIEEIKEEDIGKLDR